MPGTPPGRLMARARRSAVSEGKPAFLFDLDGTLIDSVYQHVLAWREALQEMKIELSIWRIHRRVGMSDGLILTALQGETGRTQIDQRRDRAPAAFPHCSLPERRHPNSSAARRVRTAQHAFAPVSSLGDR